MPINATTAPIGSYGSLNVEYLFLIIYKLVTGSGAHSVTILQKADLFWFYFQLVSYSVSAILLAGIAYAVLRVRDIRTEEAREFGRPAQPLQTAEERKNEKWEKIHGLSLSENPPAVL